jgi:Pyridine nucleotide-disulphide oxidoreductase, dimerisation domain
MPPSMVVTDGIMLTIGDPCVAVEQPLMGDRGVLIGATLVSPRAGEIVGELVLAIKLRTPLKALADVIHPFPAFNRCLAQASKSSPRKRLCNKWHKPDPSTTRHGGHNEYSDNQ